jgi:DNA replication protein DnaC
LANIPQRYQRFNFDVDFTEQPEAKETVEEYVANIDNAIRSGVGFYVYSPGLGTGKTAIATHIAKSAVRRAYDRVHHTVWFDSFFNLVASPQLDRDDKSFIEHKYQATQLLVIDDVTPGRVSQKQEDYFADILERVIRHRAHGSLATIVTTNMTPDELKNSYGRIFSLLSDSCEDLELDSSTDSRISRGVGELMRRSLKGEVAPIT